MTRVELVIQLVTANHRARSKWRHWRLASDRLTGCSLSALQLRGALGMDGSA